MPDASRRCMSGWTSCCSSGSPPVISTSRAAERVHRVRGPRRPTSSALRGRHRACRTSGSGDRRPSAGRTRRLAREGGLALDRVEDLVDRQHRHVATQPHGEGLNPSIVRTAWSSSHRHLGLALSRRPRHVGRHLLSQARGSPSRLRRAALLCGALQHRRDQQHVLRPAAARPSASGGSAHAGTFRVLGQALPEVHAPASAVDRTPVERRGRGRVQGRHRTDRRRRQAGRAAGAVPVALPRHA